jgi:hypothetical protein
MSRTHKLRDFQKFVVLKSRPLEKEKYSDRYGDPVRYRKQCARAHQKTNGLCCVCMARQSDQLHHSSYRKSGDRIGSNCFPVCLSCHQHICHHPKNWVIHPTDPIWKNHNTAQFTRMLQNNYKKVQQRRC